MSASKRSPTSTVPSFGFSGWNSPERKSEGGESVDRVWVEEAQRMSDETAQVLIPTVVRHPGARAAVLLEPDQPHRLGVAAVRGQTPTN